MSEGLRGALNALLFRTGDQSRDFMVVIATNRPGKERCEKLTVTLILAKRVEGYCCMNACISVSPKQYTSLVNR